MPLPASGFGSDVEHDGKGPITRATHGGDPWVQIQPVHGDGQIHLRFRCQLDFRRGPAGAAIKFHGQVWCDDPVFTGAHAAGDSEGQRGRGQKGRKISARSFKPPLIATFGQQSAARDQRRPLAIQAQFQRANAIIARSPQNSLEARLGARAGEAAFHPHRIQRPGGNQARGDIFKGHFAQRHAACFNPRGEIGKPGRRTPGAGSRQRPGQADIGADQHQIARFKPPH